MMKRKKIWLVLGLLIAALAAVLVPGSPFNLAHYMGKGLHKGRSTPEWVRETTNGDSEKRLAAIVEVGKIGSDAEAAVPELGRILIADPDANVRAQAAFALSKMAPASRGVLTELAKALTDDEPIVRFNAVRALQCLKTDSRPILPALLAALKDESNHTNARTHLHTVHQSILRSVGSASAGTSDAVPALMEYLGPTQPQMTRVVAILSLKEIGEPARAAAPRLRSLVKDLDEEIRMLAGEALAALGEPLEGETAIGAETFELPEADRKYLWKIENAGNHLVKFGFGPLANALKANDRAALARFLAIDFAGTDLREPRTIRTPNGPLDVVRLEDSGKPPLALTADGFLDLLISYRQLFRETPSGVKFNMMTLSPKTFGDLDSPIWVGTVQLRLHGESAKGAPAEIVAVIRYEIAKPSETEMNKPGWLRRAEIVQVQTAKVPQPLFADVTKERGFKVDYLYDNWKGGKPIPTTGGVFVTDFDRDGILDVLITDENGPVLYRGLPGGKFEDATTECGLKNVPVLDATAVWVDLDGDGWDDLILGRRIFKNEGGKRFVDVTAKCNLRLPDNYSNVVVADYDLDGRLDLYFARPGPPGGNSWLDHRTSSPIGNFLFHNLGNWQFEDVTKASNTGGDHRSTFSAAWLDANNDGWPDLYVPNEFGDGVMLVNQKNGTFREQALSDKPADFGTMGLAVGDLDNDGNIDIYCNNMYSKAGTRVIGNMKPDAYPPKVMERMRRFVAGSQLHMNRGEMKFDQVGTQKKVAAVGWAYGVALADFDNDGFLDIYATAGYISRNRDEPDG